MSDGPIENILEDVETLEKTKHKKLQLIQGGKTEGSPPPGANWLLNLPKGTCFLTRPLGFGKSGEPGVRQFHVVYHTPGGFTLVLTNTNNEEYTWVDSRIFSGTMELLEIQGILSIY